MAARSASLRLLRQNARRIQTDESSPAADDQLPGVPGKFFPDGRQTLAGPDGTTATGWWKDCQLHRDPKDGPALYRKGPQREYVEYCVDGERIAIIATAGHYRDQVGWRRGRLEEFWEHGNGTARRRKVRP